MATTKSRKKLRPRLFVGSSVENLDLANSIHENLEHVAEVTVWHQGIFELSETTIDELLRNLNSFDFAVFIFSPDDLIKIRGRTLKAVRDNVIFELGLFIGRLGKNRSFIIVPRESSDLRFPTDLLGVTPAKYDSNRSDKNTIAALGPACAKITRTMNRVGPISRKGVRRVSNKPVITGLSYEVRSELSKVLDDQSARIEHIVTKFDRRFEGYIQSQHKIDSSDNPLYSVADTIRRTLSPIAREILKNMRNAHITAEQYYMLLKIPYMAKAINELRRVGFIVPLKAAGDIKEPVYYFPPNLYRYINAASRLSNPNKPDVIDKVIKALNKVGYKNR